MYICGKACSKSFYMFKKVWRQTSAIDDKGMIKDFHAASDMFKAVC